MTIIFDFDGTIADGFDYVSEVYPPAEIEALDRSTIRQKSYLGACRLPAKAMARELNFQ